MYNFGVINIQSNSEIARWEDDLGFSFIHINTNFIYFIAHMNIYTVFQIAHKYNYAANISAQMQIHSHIAHMHKKVAEISNPLNSLVGT